MKKNAIIILAALFALTSCYGSYIKDSTSQGVGFANNVDVRTVVVGEGMKFSTGVALAGVINNGEDRTVGYTVDESLANTTALAAMQNHTLSYINELAADLTALKPLPSSEYSLVNEGGQDGTTVIKKNTHLGKITVQVDSAAYLAGSASMFPEFVVPLKITSGNGLDIISGFESTVIGVRYENMLFGNWYHGGKATCTLASGKDSTATYATEISQSTSKVWTLKTVSPHSLTANAVAGELNGSPAQMKLTLSPDGSILIEPVSGATYAVESDGESRFNRARLLQDRKVFLKYKYTDSEGKLWHAVDTLTFRNRVRDGVNEWQDENQENYK